MALLETGISPLVAIIGTALDVDWLPRHLKRVTLAFDGDESGIEKSSKARDTIYEHGYDVTVCHAPQDNRGKDWSERHRRYGREGLAPLLDICACGLSVHDDPDSEHGSYDEQEQYSCSKHCQEQPSEEQVDPSSHSPDLDTCESGASGDCTAQPGAELEALRAEIGRLAREEADRWEYSTPEWDPRWPPSAKVYKRIRLKADTLLSAELEEEVGRERSLVTQRRAELLPGVELTACLQ